MASCCSKASINQHIVSMRRSDLLPGSEIINYSPGAHTEPLLAK